MTAGRGPGSPGRRLRGSGLALGFAAALAAGATLGTAGTASALPGRTWLALGDSYSSGEGIPGTTRERDAQGRDCRRATGELEAGTPSDARAWAVVAYEELGSGAGFAAQDFVACTGAITDDWSGQLEEATADSGRSSWDVVSLSFGGNNIGFADVISGCLDLSLSWDFFDLTPGCDIDSDRLTRRIDMLAGDEPISDDLVGRLTLPELYDQVARSVVPGGQVVVAGYPQVIEDPGRWPSWVRQHFGVCRGIYADDAAMLRTAGEHLNRAIEQAVADADRRWANRGVTFTFADMAGRVYEAAEDGGDRHALCTEQEWLNGVTLSVTSGDWRPERSFHPTQAGHTAMGRHVATLIDRGAGGDAQGLYLYRYTSGQDAVGPTGTRRSYQVEDENSSHSTSFWVGCDARPAVTTFSLPEGSLRVAGDLLLDPGITPPELVVSVHLLGDGKPLGEWELRPGTRSPLTAEVSGVRSLVLTAERTGGTCTTSPIGYGVALDARVVTAAG
ncbi:MAG: SGNH/GDSL hydrolase family protein [Kineosporiaceae bacterium]|nr:SGNH/GDSL hydrolase family protein [Kineosporiaceae bacterium]